MNGYTEVIQVIGAMILFSIILLSTNRYMLSNTERQVGTEVEMLGVSLAQDLIDEARLRPFDAATTGGAIPIEIPGDFQAAPFPLAGVTARDDIDAFEGFQGWVEEIETNLGTYRLETEVHYVESGNLTQPTTTKTRHKRLIVTVTNPNITETIVLSYIRTYNHN